MADLTVSSISSTQSVTLPSNTTPVTQDTSGTVGPATNVQISQRAKTMQELSDLAQSDPTKFKQVTAEIADKLKQAASDGNGNPMLSKLADAFEQASQTGSMSSLTPPQQGQGSSGAQGAHHHHHHHGQGGGGAGGGNFQQTAQTIDSIVSGALSDNS